MAGGGNPGFDRHMGSPFGERQPLAGKSARFNGENARRETVGMKALDEGLRREGSRAVLRWRRDCARRSGVIPKAVEFAACSAT